MPLGILHLAVRQKLAHVLRHLLVHQGLPYAQNPFFIAGSHIVHHIGIGFTLRRNDNRVTCGPALLMGPSAHLRRHIGRQYAFHQSALRLDGGGVVIFIADFSEALLGGRACLPLIQDGLSILLRGDDQAQVHGAHIVQVTVLKADHIVAVVRGILYHRSVPRLPLLLEQPAVNMIADRRLALVLIQLALCGHGLFRLFGLFLRLGHGCLDFCLGGLISGLGILAVPCLGIVLSLCLLVCRVSQFRRLRGQFGVHCQHAIIHGIIIFLVLVIIRLDLFLGRGIAVGKFIVVRSHIQQLLHNGLQPGLGGISAVQLLSVLIHRGPSLGRHLLQGLFEALIFFADIIDEVLVLRLFQQAFVAHDILHSHLLEKIPPRQGLRIHLRGEVGRGIEPHHIKVIAVLIEVIADSHVIIIVVLHLGYVLSVHLHIGSVHREIGPDGKGRHQADQRRHDHDADDVAVAPAPRLPLLLFFSSLHLQVIFCLYLFRFLLRIRCLMIEHDHVSFLVCTPFS